MERTTQARKTRASLLTYLQRTAVSACVCLCLCVCMRVCVSLPHTYKHHQGHQEETAGAVNTHVVEHGRACLTLVEQRCCGNDVNLQTDRQTDRDKKTERRS